MTYDEVVAVALALPEVEEGTSWGTPSVKRRGRFMFRIKEDGDSIAVKLDWETRERLLADRPEACYLTPHYAGYPAVLARLDMLDPGLAGEIVRASWEDAPRKAVVRPES